MRTSTGAERLRHFHRNAGTGGVVRTVVVGGLMLAVAIMARVADDDPAPLMALVTAALSPLAWRGALVRDPAASAVSIRFGGYALMVLGFLGGLLRGHVPDALLLAAVCGGVGAYLGHYVILLSDPSVVREG